MPQSAVTPLARAVRVLRWLLPAVAAVFFALHFLHLRADFPDGTPWVDWSKYTDEGWYGDAAIRQVLFGHWRFAGDFNPAVALPVWPALEYPVFRMFGVGVVVARAFTLAVFAVTLLAVWFLLERYTRPADDAPRTSLAAPFAVLLLTTSPLFYLFERMAILEPLLICLALLALLAASSLAPAMEPRAATTAARSADDAATEAPSAQAPSTEAPSTQAPPTEASSTAAMYPASAAWRPLPASPLRTSSLRTRLLRSRFLPAIALGILLPAMVLTKTTAVCLFPAVAYLAWAGAGYRLRPTLRRLALPGVLAAVLYAGYYAVFVRRYIEDYRYLFSANAYTGIELERFDRVILHTIAAGLWMGDVLYPLFFLVLLLIVFWRPRLFLNPLVPALLLWTAGYFVFLAYHNNLQPRYYLVVAMPITLLVAVGLDGFRQAQGPAMLRSASAVVVAVALLAVAVPDALTQIGFLRSPTYAFWNAAQGIARIIRADKDHPELLLSISGSDITLMTGVPSIDDDFGVLDLGARVEKYNPGWYAAWNELDDDKMDALTPLYHPVRVASFPAMDDPERNLLILYRLDPATETATPKHTPAVTPKPLRTRLGQQPTTQQLEH